MGRRDVQLQCGRGELDVCLGRGGGNFFKHLVIGSGFRDEACLSLSGPELTVWEGARPPGAEG